MTLDDDAGPPIDAARVIADLRELDRRTGGPDGAQRVCWTETWREAREFLRGAAGRDRASSPSATRRGTCGRGSAATRPRLAVGSHIDSVPSGGWLDGALGVMAGVGVLRAWAEAGERAAVAAGPRRLGRRGGRALRPQPVRQLGVRGHARSRTRRASSPTPTASGLPDALAENGVELDRVLEAGSRRDGLGAYLELHIEQGPVLEAEGVATAAVNGCAGVERQRFTLTGQASHAGTTPMELRRDAGLAAADAALRIEADRPRARRRGDHGRAAAGPRDPHGGGGRRPSWSPTCATPRPAELAAMLDERAGDPADAAEARGCSTRRGGDLADRAAGLRPRAGRARPRRLPRGERHRARAHQRRPPRRRRGVARRADRDDLRPLARRPLPHRARGHRPRPTWRGGSRRSGCSRTACWPV